MFRFNGKDTFGNSMDNKANEVEDNMPLAYGESSTRLQSMRLSFWRSSPRRHKRRLTKSRKSVEDDFDNMKPSRREDFDMNTAKRKRLEKAGWKVGTVQEFLNLSSEEAAYVEVKLNLAKVLSNRRKSLRLTQLAVAKKIKSSQSRVAKMEAGDPSVSIDLLVRSLIALGETPTNLHKAL